MHQMDVRRRGAVAGPAHIKTARAPAAKPRDLIRKEENQRTRTQLAWDPEMLPAADVAGAGG
ncbi:hypothetical protein ACIQNU_39950 [Streptomyces sp. NPDC091292]|uniref:hypothetical protein n=1 Tax=Streptomyces sp. NPDC091292 TaxID=3365991 RepID=UPI00381F6A96